MKLENHPTVKRFRELSQTIPDGTLGEKLDAHWLKQLVLNNGADDVGLVEIDHPELNDQRADMLEIFPRTQTLIAFVCRLNPENIRCVSQAVRDLEFIRTQTEADTIARKITQALAQKGVGSLNYASAFPMDLDQCPGKMWGVSHKPIAVAAGLGQLGHNRNLLHPRFGHFIILNTLLVDHEATAYDTPLDYNPCTQCKLCVAVCLVGAIGSEGEKSFLGPVAAKNSYQRLTEVDESICKMFSVLTHLFGS